jgi:hypothetical protein
MGRDYKGTICDKQTLDADILNAKRFLEKKVRLIHTHIKNLTNDLRKPEK